jgi:transcription elongation factor Elf1
MSAVNPAGLNQRTHCPGCESSEFDALLKAPYSDPLLRRYFSDHYGSHVDISAVADGSFTLVRCRVCHLAFQLEVPNDPLLGEIYDKWIDPSEQERLHNSYTLNDYRYLAEQIQLLIQLLQRPPAAIEVLDFGMGWAEWACMARGFGCRVAGAELSQARTQSALALGIEVVDWAGLPASRFNFINVEQVMEHLVDPLATLRRLANATAPGGIVRIAVPDARQSLRKLAGSGDLSQATAHELMTIAPLEHINSFEHASLEAMGRRAGLTPLRPSLLTTYDSGSGWWRPRNAARLLTRPLYRHWFPKSTIAYFRKN